MLRVSRSRLGSSVGLLLAAVLASGVLLAVPGPVSRTPAAHAASADETSVGSVIVKYKRAADRPGASPISAQRLARLQAAARPLDVRLDYERTMLLGAYVVRLSQELSGAPLTRLVEALGAADDDVEWVEPNWRIQPQTANYLNDPLLRNGTQWNLQDGPGGIRAQEAWDEEWTFLADEYAPAYLPGGQTGARLVRYGAYGGNWDYALMSGDFECSNETFDDLASGKRKRCEVSRDWSTVAEEGANPHFSLHPATTSSWVRFGWGERWVVKRVTGAGECTNEYFGKDPARDTHKVCQVQELPDGLGVVASEGDTLSVGPHTTIRYGANGGWKYFYSEAGYTRTCDNVTFGDPKPDERKRCEVVKSMGSGVLISVVDEGRVDHPDLKTVPSIGFHDGVVSTVDRDQGLAQRDCPAGRWNLWHGLTVAGVAAATAGNDSDIAGVAPMARVMMPRAGHCNTTLAEQWDSMLWSVGITIPRATGPLANRPENHSRIVNVSWDVVGGCTDGWLDVIRRIRERGAVLVAAAGNSGADFVQDPRAPAVCADAITVAGSDKTGNKPSWSNYGYLIDLAAPGQDVTTLMDFSADYPAQAPGSLPMSGTSLATPHVSGVLALMLGKNPALSGINLETRLGMAARPFSSGSNCASQYAYKCGVGILDAARALRSAEAIITERTGDNDDHATADVITAPADVTGRLQTSTRGCTLKDCPLYNDRDVFAVDLLPDGSLTVKLKPGPGCADICRFALKNPLGPHTYAKQWGGYATYDNTSSKTERIYIYVDKSNDVSRNGDYTVLATWK